MVRGEAGEYHRSMSLELLHSRWRSFLFVVAIFLVIGPISTRGDEPKADQSTLNDGYSLFYDFCKQESQLSLLRWVKTMPPGISDYAKQISSTAEADMAVLKRMGVVDN